MSNMLSADQAFLTQQEYLKIIQQCEQSNFSDQQMVDLLLWAQDAVMRYEMLCQFFEGRVQIEKVENKEPFFSLTQAGIKDLDEIEDDETEENI